MGLRVPEAALVQQDFVVNAGIPQREPLLGKSGHLRHVLRAGGDAKYTMTVSMISMWLFRVLACYVFVLKMNMGLFGVWLGMYIDWVCRMICFALRFAGGRWMDHKVI